MPLIRLLQRFNDLLKRVEMGLIVLAVPVMMVMGALQILSRFIIQQPIPWSEGLLTFLFVWTSYLGASLAVAEKAHFQVDIFTSYLSPELQRKVDWLATGFVIFFAVFMTKYAWFLLMRNQHQIIGLLGISVSWGFLSIVFSGVCMVTHALTHLAESVFSVEPLGAKEA